jgi:hypothetical protein
VLDRVTINLRSTDGLLPIYFDVYDNSLSRKWLSAFNNILDKKLHLEKNYCFFGFPDCERNLDFLVSEINRTIAGINGSSIDYLIKDYFTVENILEKPEIKYGTESNKHFVANHEKFNQLHLYFEETQGVSGAMSEHYTNADAETRWYIRQLNLLCHETECLILSLGQKAKEWVRPSNVMCWLHAPRFVLEEEDYQLFGIDTIARHHGGVYVGVNKAVGKHHWEVFLDEGSDSRVDELTTTTLKPQTEAAGDFDIEWGKNVLGKPFMTEQLEDFRAWLLTNGFDPEDPYLTIGHPKIGQIDLEKSFGTTDFEKVLKILSAHLDVYSIKTNDASAEYEYTWRDSRTLQVPLL